MGMRANGIYEYDGTEPFVPTKDALNLLGDSVSDVVDGLTGDLAVLGSVSARHTANVGPITTAEPVLVTAPPVAVDGSTRVKITVTPASLAAVQYEFWEFRVRRGSTLVFAHQWVAPSNARTGVPSLIFTDLPPAGTHTYALSVARTGGTGAATVTASATNPAEIIVEGMIA